MTKEQEAIEICKKEIIEPFYDFPNPTSIELKDTDVEAIETVLSMLKEKDAEIEEYKRIITSGIINAAKDELVQEKNKEIEQKEKQIDLMATTLSAICTGLSTVREQFEKSYCEFINSDKDCCWKRDTSCKDCIKQYFERKSRE